MARAASAEAATTTTVRRRWTRVAIGLVFSGVFTYLFLRRIELREVAAELAKVNLPILALSLLTTLAGYLAWTWRSRLLLRPVCRFPLLTLLRSILLSFALNNVLPLRMGELARIEYLARRGGLRRSTTLAVVGLERLLDVFSLALVVCAVLPLTPVRVGAAQRVFLILAVLVAGVAVAVAVSRHPEPVLGLAGRLLGLAGRRVRAVVEPRAAGLVHGLAAIRSLPGILSVLGLSLAHWLTSLTSVRIWLLALGIELPWYAPVVILAFIAFGVSLPAAPGFVGTYHYFALTVLTMLGVETATAVTFAVVAHFMAVVPFTVLSAPLLLSDYLGTAAQRRT